jgi:glyoxylase-like metal-dependent hydrolase (beta-lactamase superfamily II)
VVGHVTASASAVLAALPDWATRLLAPNPGPMTLDGTNTWILRPPGSRECVVVDPGPLDDGHVRAIEENGPIAGIFITHGHVDHVEAVPRVAELTGAPVGPEHVDVGLLVRSIATPGHTADSVSYLISHPDGSQPALLTGDTVLGRGTTVVAWPDGDLGDYLESLRRIADLGPAVPALPGHGPPLSDSSIAATFYLKHRLARLDQVRAALKAGDTSAEEVVARVYADVDKSLWPAARSSVHAQLAYLRRESHPPSAELDSP